MRGFVSIGLDSPKTPENVGGALRAAHCYGASSVSISGARLRDVKHPSNTPKAHRHTPTFMVDDLFDHLPVECAVVAVDLVPDAEPLPKFRHPERALYLFGPEDGTLSTQYIRKADHCVYVPTRNCMNLAATVNVVLYDRLCKLSTPNAQMAS